MSLEDPFLTEMKGKARVSEQISSAGVWTPREGQFAGIPRPDVHRFSLLLWSAFGGLLGLDHFYMRSPWTGLAKLFTGGGFGLWWLWDAFQLGLESDRVVKYGMSAPFDLITGIGQGMIYDGKPTMYKSEKSFGFWVVAKILFGLIFDDHGWVALFKIIIFILTVISCVYTSQGYLLWIIALCFAGPLCLANIWAWVSDSSTIIANPTGFVNQGLPTPDFTYKSYLALKNWFINSKTGKIIEGEQKPLDSLQVGSTRIFPLKEGITPVKLQQMFAINHTGEMKQDKPVQKGGAVPSFLKNTMGAVTQAASQVKTVAAGVTRQTRSSKPATQPPASTKDPKDSPPTATKPTDPNASQPTTQPPATEPKDPNASKPPAIEPKDPNDSQPSAIEPKDPNASPSVDPTAAASKENPDDLENQGVPSGNPLSTLFGRIWQSGVDNTLIMGGRIVKGIAFAINPAAAAAAEAQLQKMEMMKKAGGAGGALGALGGLAGGLPGGADLGGLAGGLPGGAAGAQMNMPQQQPQQPQQPQPQQRQPVQQGGYRRSQDNEEPLSTEAQIMGATLIALIAGGSLKGLVDYIMPQ